MYYKPFKDISISALGFGGLRLPMVPGQNNVIDREAGQKVIDEAFRQGINYFDTAYTYQNGDSERFLGEALSRYPRNSYFLATKFYSSASKDIDAVFHEQLSRLKTDYFDFYMLHSMDENYIDDYTNPAYDYIGYLKKQRDAGRIRYLGFSTHAAPATLRRFLDYFDGWDMALMQLNYLDWTLLDAKGQYDLLTARGIPVWVMEPLKGGRLATLNDSAAAILKQAAPERSLASWGMRFLQGLPNVQTVLSGMATVEQVQDNAATFAAPDPLHEEEQAVLQKAKAAFLGDLGIPCSACRYCCSTCPAGLDIPLLIKGFNERNMTVGGQTWRVPGLDKAIGPENCIQCGTCLAHCPQKIDIPQVLASFAALREEDRRRRG